MKIKISKHTFDKTSNFDIIICVVGYEKRSSYIPTLGNNVNKKIAIAFNDNNVLSYDSNMKCLESANYSIVENDINQIDTALSTAISTSLLTNKRASIVIDISSMTRKMIAILLQWFKDYEQSALLDLVFAYASAKFIKINEDIGPITITEPVIPEFAGWPIDPDLPPSGIIGLGYEYDRALGVIEFLETSPVWVFVPRGEDIRYDKENDEANADLHEIIPSSNFVEYRVDDPMDCYIRLESLIYGLMKTSRPIIVPFGPKIFSLVSLLVAIEHSGDVSVWRVSGDKYATPIDREASGKLISLAVNFTEQVSSC